MNSKQSTNVLYIHKSTDTKAKVENDILYAIKFWLPILGPSATLIFYTINEYLEYSNKIYISSNELASKVGIGKSTLTKGLERLEDFRYVERNHQYIKIISGWPLLSPKMLSKLTSQKRNEYFRYIETPKIMATMREQM